MLPIPPSTAAVNELRPNRKPRFQTVTLLYRIWTTPAAPASAPPMRNVIAIVRLTSTPIRPAVSGSCAVARIARPWRVLATNQVRTNSSGIVTRPTKTCDTVIVTLLIPKNDSRFVVGKMFSIVRWLDPAKMRPTFWRTKLIPIAVISGASLGAWRSGR